MSNFEAVADGVGAALMSREVERAASAPGSDGHTHENACLNCGAPLTGPFCNQCGQHGHVHRTLGAFFHDLLHGVFHFEGKIWRTLPLLAWHPGRLTRDYVEGKRASFVSPIALFLFSVFIMFAAVSLSGNLDNGFKTETDIAKSEETAKKELARLQSSRAERVAERKTTLTIDREIKETQDSLDTLRMLREKGVTGAILSRPGSELKTDVPYLAEAYRKAKENPTLLIYKLKSNSYKWSWALIPLSVPFMWLLFPFSRRFRTYDHVVFVTYSLSFVSLLVVMGTILASAGLPQLGGFLMFVPPIHIYRQLRGAYSLGRFGAAWRTVVLLFGAVLVLSFFVLAMVGLGVLD